MAVIYAAELRTARLQAVVDAIDAGTAGKLKLYTSGDALLATLTLADPCGTVSGDILTFDADPDITAAASGTGTVAKATITTSADAVVISGLTVGTGSENIPSS
jgi:tetrahydromethanopterin S-methyltransferase subunit H